MAAEGFLAICGSCRVLGGFILLSIGKGSFPLRVYSCELCSLWCIKLHISTNNSDGISKRYGMGVD